MRWLIGSNHFQEGIEGGGGGDFQLVSLPEVRLLSCVIASVNISDVL